MKQIVLKNGLRTIIVPINGVRSVTVMKSYHVGSRHETKELNGAAHFAEHMMFKGGNRYKDTKAITSALERIGAQYNAYTEKEATTYYAKVPAAYFELACDVISDMTYNAHYDAAELEKERGVILEEMKSYEDDPSSHVDEVFDNLVFGDTPIGRNIVGTRETVSKVSREQLFAFKQKYYNDANSVLIVVGALPDNVEEILNKYFDGAYSTAEGDIFEKAPEQGINKAEAVHRDIEQAHFVFGFPCEGYKSPKLYAYQLITEILGGGMGSRLFEELREKRGLCYGISMGRTSLADTGMLTVKSSVNNDKYEEALAVLKDELKKFADGNVSQQELDDAKSGLCGGLDLALENTVFQAQSLIRYYVLTGEIVTPEERIQKLNAVTLEEVKTVAAEVLDLNKANLAVIRKIN